MNNKDTLIWDPEQREGMVAKTVAFLISPVLGMLTAFVHPNTKSSFLILMLSFMTIGLTMDVPDERTETLNFDSTTYRHTFENYAEYNSSDFTSAITAYADMSEEAATDIYAGLVYYFVSRFTDNYHACFMVIAAVFAFFMLQSLRYLVAESDYKFSFICLLLLFLFTMAQIDKINMFRFYTAYWMAIYALFKLIIDGDKRYWILLAATPAVHASFLIIFGIYLLYAIMRDRQNFSVIVVLAMMVFSSVSVEVFSWLTMHLPGNLGSHYGSYLNEWYMQKINESGTGYKWVVRLLEAAVRWSMNIITLFFAITYRSHIEKTKSKNIYFFLLALMAFVDFTFMIPSVGSRFFMIAFPLIAYIWLVSYAKDSRYNILIFAFTGMYLLLFFVLPWNIYQIPCFAHYLKLWHIDSVVLSPVYLFIKYLAGG